MLSELELHALIGKTLPEAEAAVARKGGYVRVTHEDGEDFIITCDLRTDRLNVALEHGRIIGTPNIG